MTLRELIKSKGYKAKDFAKLMYITTAGLQHWLRGVRMPGLPNIIRMAQLLEVPEQVVIEAVIETGNKKKGE